MKGDFTSLMAVALGAYFKDNKGWETLILIYGSHVYLQISV